MSPLLFHYTLCILLISIVTFSLCFSSFLITHNKITGLTSLIFFTYFFDVAIVFQNDYLALTNHHFYQIGSPSIALITGLGILQAMWLAYCEILKIKNKTAKYIPPLIFVILSFSMNFFIETPNIREFWFYTTRALFFFFILGVGACSLILNKSTDERSRILQYAPFQIGLWLLGSLVVGENVICLLILKPETIMNAPLPFLPERNFAENLLMVYAAVCISKKHASNLALRFDKPINYPSSPVDRQIQQQLEYFSKDKKLSKREAEVLELLLKGNTAQEIAQELFLSPSTVKVHTHNIYKKAGASSKKDLLQIFWKYP